MRPTRIWASFQESEGERDYYVLDLVHNQATATTAGLLSNGKLRVLSAELTTNSEFEDVPINRSSGRVTGIATYSGVSSLGNNLLWTCSSDGLVNGWDLKTPHRQTAASCSFNRAHIACIDVGLDGTLLACGTEEGFDSKIVFWDVRNLAKPIGIFEESHSDSITTLRFCPDGSSSMLSGSDDGLVCAFDLSKPNETAALKSVLNAGSACSKLGFFGANYEGMYVTTTTETLSLFEVKSCARITSYENNLLLGSGCRELLQGLANQEVNYLVDCLWEPKTQKLLVLAGNSLGNGFGFELTLDSFLPLGPLNGGHTELIRCSKLIDFGPTKGFGLLTGGEDGKICLWAPE